MNGYVLLLKIAIILRAYFVEIPILSSSFEKINLLCLTCSWGHKKILQLQITANRFYFNCNQVNPNPTLTFIERFNK